MLVAAEQLGDFYRLKRGKQIACFIENLQPVILIDLLLHHYDSCSSS